MSSFVTRAISAAIAVLALVFSFFLWGKWGLDGVVFFVVALGGIELSRILFNDLKSKLIKTVFYFCLFLIFSLSCWRPDLSGLFFAFFSVCFSILVLFNQQRIQGLHAISLVQGRSVLGFFYLGLLPSLIFKLLQEPSGVNWFLSLLGVVFMGDIFAYLIGLKFGKRKLLPLISPKKTVEGAFGGLLGSLLAGLVLGYFVLKIPFFASILISLSAAVVGQVGDLFESLLKRVAEVKDSGSIMPGHGGILDRIDGVLFAGPIFLLAYHLLVQ